MTSDNWLVLQSGLILGPYNIEQLVEGLLAGEISPDALVQLLGTIESIPLEQIPDLDIQTAVAKARVKAEYDASLKVVQEAKQRKVRRLGIIIGVAVLAVVAVVAIVGRRIAIHSDFGTDGATEEITVDAPIIKRAKIARNDDLVYLPGATRGVGSAKKTANGKPKPGEADAEGLDVGRVDDEGLTAIVSKNKPTLIPCIRQALPANSQAMKIPIEFAVGNDGKVSKVWVDNADFKENGRLNECLLAALQKWPFKTGSASAAISLSFNVGARQ